MSNIIEKKCWSPDQSFTNPVQLHHCLLPRGHSNYFYAHLKTDKVICMVDFNRRLRQTQVSVSHLHLLHWITI